MLYVTPTYLSLEFDKGWAIIVYVISYPNGSVLEILLRDKSNIRLIRKLNPQTLFFVVKFLIKKLFSCYFFRA